MTRIAYFDLLSDSDSDEPSSSHASVCIIGAPRVGKTSFISRLVKRNFTFHYIPTKTIEITGPVEIGNHLFTFYDISCHNNPLHTNQTIYADAVVFMYNEKRDATIQQLPDLFEKILPHIHPDSKFEAFFINQQFTRCLLKQEEDGRTFQINNCSNEGFQQFMYALDSILFDV